MNLTRYEHPEEPTVVLLEGSAVRCFPENGEPNMWLASTDLGKAIGLGQSRMSQIFKELCEEDKGIRLTNTPGGKQRLTVVSRSGAYQVIAQLQDKELGRRLRKWLADLGVAHETGKLSQSRLSKEDIQFIVQAVTEAVLPAIAALVSPKIVRPVAFQTKSYRREDLQPWTIEAHRKLGKENWTLSASYLHKVTGTKAPGSKAAGLTARTIAYGRERNIEPRRLLMAGKVLTYLPEAHLRTVHQTGWRRKNAILSEAQAELFEGPLFNGDSGRVA